MLSSRCRNILMELLKTEVPVRLQEFSARFQVSERTIRNDLGEIQFFLESNHLASPKREKRGVILSVDESSKQKLLRLLESPLQNMVLLTPDERLLQLLCDFVAADGYLTLDQQAERLGISKSTVTKDLEHLKTILHQENVSIASGLSGSKLSGNESAIRLAVMNLFFSHMNRKTRVEALEMLMNSEKLFANQVCLKIFDGISPFIMAQCMEIIEISLQKRLSDDNYLILAGNLSVQVKRILCGYTLAETDSEMNTYILSYKIAETIAGVYKEGLGLVLSEAEKRHICRVLECVANETLSLGERINRAEIQILGCYIVENAARLGRYNFLYDNVLLCGLSNELLTILLKQKLGLPPQNPLLAEIKNRDPVLFKTARQSLEPLENLLGRKATDDEVSLVAMHFLDALDRGSGFNDKKFNVLVVCSEGETFAKMMSNRIAAQFDVSIVGAVGYGQAKSTLAEGKANFVVSTVESVCRDIPSLKVNPLLTQADIDRLKACLPTRTIDTALVENIIDVVSRFCEVKDQQQMMLSLYDLLGISGMAGYNSSRMPTLERVLCADNIVLDFPAESWQEAVRKVGGILFENGFIQWDGIAAMERNMVELKENSVVSPGVMMAHSRSYELTYRVGIAMVRLRHPVKLFDTDKEIGMVFALAALDNKTHLVALSQLAQVLNDNERLGALWKENSPCAVLKIFQSGLENKGD